MTSRFPPLQTWLNELGLLSGIMAAVGKFVLSSDDDVIVFSEQMRTRKVKMMENYMKGSQKVSRNVTRKHK